MELLLNQLFATLPLAVLFGIYGTIASWERSSFFGHVLSHSLLLPPSVCFLFGFTLSWQLTAASIIFATIFGIVCSKIATILPQYNQDTLLIMVSFVCTAGSLIINSISGTNANIMLYITGDMLLVQKSDISILYVFALAVLAYVWYFWEILILRVFNKDLAMMVSKHASLISMIFLVSQAIFIAIAIKMVGILLISATMIMPAILARPLSNEPHHMVIWSVILGFIVMLIGSSVALYLDTQIGPTIVIVYSFSIAIIYSLYAIIRRRKHT